MLSSSDFNSAVPKFTNGNYANNPTDPAYVEEPSMNDYNRGVEPLDTLPAQWWNWLCNQFTKRFNKLNTYVKNLFDEITQLLSLLDVSPDGTESVITTGQLKNYFKELYPSYVNEKLELGSTYVPKTTTVNGHELTGDVSVTRADLGLGTSATVNTGSDAGCIPLVGSALGTTDGKILVTDTNGKIKPSSVTVGTAAGNATTDFRSCTWIPSCLHDITNASCYSTMNYGATALSSPTYLAGWNGYELRKVCTSTLSVGSAGYATCLYNRPSGASKVGNVYFYTNCTNSSSVATNFEACICGVNGCLYNIGGIKLAVTEANSCKSKAIGSSACTDGWEIYGCVGGSDQYNLILNLTDDGNNFVGFACNGCVKSCVCGSNGYFYGNVCGNVCGLATRAGYATCLYNRPSGANCVGNVYFYTNCTNSSCAATNQSSCICGANGYYYGNICGNVCGTASSAVSATSATSAGSATNATNASCASTIARTGYTNAYDFDVLLTNGSSSATGTVAYVSNKCRLTFCNTTGVLKSVAFCGYVYGCACCAGAVYNRYWQSGNSYSEDICFYFRCYSCSHGNCDRVTYICGSNAYYYGNICGNVCGTACCALNATNATNATNAMIATCASTAGKCFCDNDLYVCAIAGASGATYQCIVTLYVCNKNSSPVIFTNPKWTGCGTACCAIGCCTITAERIDSIAMGNALIQVEANCYCCIGSYYVCVYNNSSGGCKRCWNIPYRLLGYTN